MLLRFLYRAATEVSWRLLFKAARLWCGKSFFALRAFKKRSKKGIQFPPFLFFSLTNRCNLRCRGCWVESARPHPNPPPEGEGTFSELSGDAIENVIKIAQKESVYFYTLLGGEPFLAPKTLWNTIRNHPEAYFQIITNGLFFDEATVRQIKQYGNISPLVSIDGFEKENDNRRGQGTFANAIEGCRELQRQKILYGVATTVTADNFESTLTEEYVNHFVKLGAMYLWFYVYRPAGADPVPEWSVKPDMMLELRRRLLRLRRKMPIILIDTYWNAQGFAVCPASKGMAFVIGPKGSIEPCPPLNVTKEWISDNGGDFYETMNNSEFLLRFREFIGQQYNGERSQGCVLIDYPQELAQFFRSERVTDVSGRNFLEELSQREPLTSHYLPGQEIPEDYWVYRILKKMLFFGMGAYG
ncbi:MAG: radical SAM protein [Planctomycetaceae bacterium]|nr:radical SAM protein [Planctomycetaceae bacterium]